MAAALRAIPAAFDAASLSEIDARLAGIRRDHAVTIALAIESGSRAWGFPSPDSDYDCRFLYVRGADAYLSPWAVRDVIELPLAGDMDINGWDLGKALKLVLKGNAVVIEWLMSPIVYTADAGFREDLRAFAARFADRDRVANHYLHLGERQRRTYFAEGKPVALKKIFYALRPAAALRWLRLHPDATMPPMHFPTLMDQCAAPTDVHALTRDLIARKAVTRELGDAALPAAIEAFIDAEFARARSALAPRPAVVAPAAKDAADALFRAAVRRFDAGAS